MTHLDEGTIHAWLDGALNDAESKQASEHVASCAQCGALVAEARGLIAGASRILTALDDVPAGIAPKRAPVVASSKPARRYWQAAPWVTGIAAALILAVGLKTWLENPSAKDAVAPTAPAAPVARVMLRVDSLSARSMADSSRRATDASPRVIRASAPPSTPTHPRPLASEDRREPQIPQPVAAEAMRRGSGAGAAAVADVAPLAKAAAALGGELKREVAAGCYRSDTALVERTASLGVASKAAPAEPQFARRQLIAPSVVRLDTAGIVRSAATGAAIGTWVAADADSARLNLASIGTRTLPNTNRVACPPPQQ